MHLQAHTTLLPFVHLNHNEGSHHIPTRILIRAGWCTRRVDDDDDDACRPGRLGFLRLLLPLLLPSPPPLPSPPTLSLDPCSRRNAVMSTRLDRDAILDDRKWPRNAPTHQTTTMLNFWTFHVNIETYVTIYVVLVVMFRSLTPQLKLNLVKHQLTIKRHTHVSQAPTTYCVCCYNGISSLFIPYSQAGGDH